MTYSVDLRERVVSFVQNGGSKSEAARVFEVSRWCIYDWLNRETLEPAKQGVPGAWKLDMEALKAHVEQHPDAYQHERGVALGVSRHVILHGLKRLKLTRKKNATVPRKERRTSQGIPQYPEPDSEKNRVYVDETGFDAPLIREYAYSRKGERIEGERTGNRFARTSLIAGLKENKPIAPMEFRGYCDTQVILSWVQEMLVPCLKPGDWVIWDNATFHKSAKIAEALTAAGIGLLFLPPYSPDLNPIEHLWAWIKAWIRALNLPLLHISQALAKVFGSIFT